MTSSTGIALADSWCDSAPSTESRWYAVYTRSNFESRVADEIEGKGVETYLPQYAEMHQWKDRKRSVDIPLFPGYLFARFSDRPHARLAVLQVRGVVKILGDSRGIEPVPDDQVEAVRRLLKSNLPCSVHPLLREGTVVRVKRGALANLEGILVRVKSEARLVVSVPLLSRSVAVEVDARNVEPVRRTLVA